MFKKKGIVFVGLTLFCLFSLLVLFVRADDKQTGMVVPANIPNPSTTRKITIQQIKGGSGNIDTENLLDGTQSLTQGWTADSTAKPATYTVKKIVLNAGQTAPNKDGSNYTTVGSANIVTQSGQGQLELGSPNAHIVGLEDFYTDHFNGTNEAVGPAPDASPDGFYEIKETGDVSDHEPYQGILSVPYMQEDPSGATNDAQMIYDLHIFPKMIQSVGMGFHTYVNVIDDDATVLPRFESRSTTPGEFDYSHWLHDSVMNGSTNYWTIGIDLSHQVFDAIYGGTKTTTPAANSYIFGLGFGTDGPLVDAMSGEKATNGTEATTPTILDSGITGARPDQNTAAGVLLTNLNTGERKYFLLGATNGKTITASYGGKSFTLLSGTGTGFNNQIPDGNSTWGYVVRYSDKASLLTFFGTQNPFGGDYAGVDLLDPASGYGVQLTVTKHVKTKGLHFNADTIADEASKLEVRPWEFGFYEMPLKNHGNGGEGNGSGENDYVTTYGINTALENGFLDEVDDTTTIQGHADGYGKFGVTKERAYITTGNLNALKINEEGQALGGAQFVIKIKENASGVTGTPGQDGLPSSLITPGQYLIFGASDGAVTSTTTKSSATKLTSLTSGIIGKLQALGLDEDLDYVLEEITSPPGYQALNQPLQLLKANISKTTWQQDQDDSDLVQIVNLPKVVLPVTGGNSLWIVFVIGGILVGVGILQKRKVAKS
jgi:hypothetical protein